MGKAKRRRSFNLGILTFFLKLKFLLKHQKIRNKILKAIITRVTNLEARNKKNVVFPSGITNFIIIKHDRVKKPVIHKSNINCVSILIFIISNKLSH